jgi:YD repeat-containing protein
VSAGTQNLVTNTYQSRTRLLTNSAFGNGQSIGFGYDSLRRVSSKSQDGTVKFNYTYDANGNLAKKEDLVNSVKTRYIYSVGGKLAEVSDDSGNNFAITYDALDNVSAFADNKRGDSVSYTYNDDSQLSQVTKGSSNVNYTYDVVGRLSGKSIVDGGNTFAT